MIRLYDKLINGLAGLSGLVIGAICLLIVYDVIARNLGLQPPASTVALTEYALLYFTMAAAPWLVRRRGHIVVEVLYRKLPASAQRRAGIAIAALCAIVSVVIAVLATVLAIEAFQRGEIEVRSLDTPRWVLFAPMSVGFALMACEFIHLVAIGASVFPDAAADSGQTQSF